MSTQTEKLKADWAKEITDQVIAITKQVTVLTKATIYLGEKLEVLENWREVSDEIEKMDES